MASIDGFAHPIKTVLSQVLVIPDYQRDYSWTPKKEVKALLDDFADHLAIDDSGTFGSSANDDYLLGPMITTKSGAAVEVIDGQQRLMTVYLLTCALRLRLLELRPTDGMIGGLSEILTKFDAESGNQIANIRHHDEDVVTLLTELATQDPSGSVPRESGSLSRQRTVRAFKYITQRLRDDVPPSADSVQMYAKFLREFVKLISISTPDIDAALYVFERANDRGKPLDPSDLLKNLIFRESDAESFSELSSRWKMIQEDIEAIPKNDLSVQLIDYLRWIHLTMEDGFYSTRRNFYSQMSQPGQRQRVSKDASGYIRALQEGAKHLRFMATRREWPDGTPSNALEGIYAMGGGEKGGGRQKQHWPLIIAASRFSEARREAIARGVEKLLFVSGVTQLKSQSLELLIRRLAVGLRDVSDTDVEVRAFIVQLEANIDHIKTEELFETRFFRLNYTDDRAMVRYVLVRVHSALRQEGQSGSPAWPVLMHQVFLGSQIDHVWPQSTPQGFVADGNDSEEAIHAIGNLVLLDSATNQAAGNMPAPKKLLEFYPDAPSEFMVARNLHHRQPPPGSDTRPKRVNKRLLTGFDSWGVDQADELAEFYLLELERSMVDIFPSAE